MPQILILTFGETARVHERASHCSKSVEEEESNRSSANFSNSLTGRDRTFLSKLEVLKRSAALVDEL
jgi:hypothetical protein